MRFNQFYWLQLGVLLGGLAQPAIAEVKTTPITRVSRVKDHPRSATTVKEWLTQAAANQIVQVTNVELKPTTDGLDVVLVTQTGAPLQGTTAIQGNQLIKPIWDLRRRQDKK